MATAIYTIDPVLLSEKIDEQYIDHEYAKQTREGEVIADDAPMKARVFELVLKKKVTSKEDLAKASWTNGELYAAVFPGAPGTDPKTLHVLDEVDAEVRKRLMRKVWGLTQGTRSGFIQKKLGTEGSRMVLCRSISTRGLDDVEVCFVTENPDLIMSESVMPQVETLVKKANDLRLHAEMVQTRRPELEQRITRELGLGVRRVEAALPAGDDVTAASNGGGA